LSNSCSSSNLNLRLTKAEFTHLVFRMRLPHCIAIFYNLPWFFSIKVSSKKSQRNVENACGNRMCKRTFIRRFSVHSHFMIVFFWQKNTGKKGARKIMVKLITGQFERPGSSQLAFLFQPFCRRNSRPLRAY